MNKERGLALIPILAVAVVLAVLVGLFVYQQRRGFLPGRQEARDEVLEEIQTQGASDEIQAIEEDLENTDFDFIDSDLQQIEAEVEAEATAQ